MKGIIHVGLYDFPEHDCYTKLVGTRVVGVEANKFVYDTMAKPVADECGYLCFNECLYSEDGLKKQFFLANDCSTLNPVAYSAHLSAKLSRGSYVDVTTKKLSTLIEENNIDMNQYDFLNIDVEGAELAAIRSAYKLFNKHFVDNVVVEFGPPSRWRRTLNMAPSVAIKVMTEMTNKYKCEDYQTVSYTHLTLPTNREV
mgnify:CR=1 FL=1